MGKSQAMNGMKRMLMACLGLLFTTTVQASIEDDLASLRDPFQPYFQAKSLVPEKAAAEAVTVQTASIPDDLSGLRLVATFFKSGVWVAMAEKSSGQAVLLKKGAHIGSLKAEVISVQKDQVSLRWRQKDRFQQWQDRQLTLLLNGQSIQK